MEEELLFLRNTLIDTGVSVLQALFFCVLVCWCLTPHNISVISSVLLVDETGGLVENLSQVTDKLDHIMLYTSP